MRYSIFKRRFIYNKGKIFTPVIFFLFCSACVKNREITLPEEKERIVINCLFNPDSIWQVNLSATKPVVNTSPKFTQIGNAVIQLYENSVFAGNFTYTSRGNYFLNSKPKVGKQYKITVSALGYESVYAQDSIPKPAGDIVNGSINTNETIQSTDPHPPYISYAYHPVGIQIKDNSNDDNFYRISIVRELLDTAQLSLVKNTFHLYKLYNYFDIYSNDQQLNSLSSNQCFLLFSNTYFKGQHKNIIAHTGTNIYQEVIAYWDTLFYPPYDVFNVLSVNAFNESGTIPHINYDLYIELRTVSRAYYNYSFSLLQQVQSANDPFAEFKNVYTNVKGGYGIFAGYQSVRLKVN